MRLRTSCFPWIISWCRWYLLLAFRRRLVFVPRMLEVVVVGGFKFLPEIIHLVPSVVLWIKKYKMSSIPAWLFRKKGQAGNIVKGLLKLSQIYSHDGWAKSLPSNHCTVRSKPTWQNGSEMRSPSSRQTVNFVQQTTRRVGTDYFPSPNAASE